MSSSNKRIKTCDTYHHLMSRIAHKVYFLTEEVRTRFVEMIRRAADYCGIRLVAWCVMTNHFHILAYLPPPEDIDEEETLRRYGVLKGKVKLQILKAELFAMRQQIEGEQRALRRLEEIRRPMYKIGEFMKIIKQWITQDYNHRYAHAGTLWEAVYRDVAVRGDGDELNRRAAYIHLNPIRAAMIDDFCGYQWSSLAALKCGDEHVLEGMRRIYGNAATAEAIIADHCNLMARLLEQVKLEMARDIAQKRMAGFDIPVDPLTAEALIAQEMARMKKIATAMAMPRKRGRPSEAENLEKMIRAMLAKNPDMRVCEIIKAAGQSRSAVFRCLRRIRSA